MTKGIWAIAILAVLITTCTVGLSIIPAHAVLGDIISVIDLSGFIDAFCSVGVAFDGTDLYVDQCFDGRIWRINTAGVVQDVRDFSVEIPENPNAMAFDAKRGGLWVGAQGCQFTPGREMPIYFVDFQGTPLTFADDIVTLEFTIPETLINPATTDDFLNFCFTDGLAYKENDPTTAADDELWFSDDVNEDIGLFRPTGAFVAGFDASTIDASFLEFPAGSGNSGLAIGGSNLFLGNNGGGDVFRAAIPAFTLFDQFVIADERQEDMECDPVTFAPTQVMWVRTTPQGGSFPNVLTAYEIEPGTCGIGGQDPLDGKMTGGGSIKDAGIRVTHGFELFCDTNATPNNIEVNWDKGNKFHLQSLTAASCFDDAVIMEGNPVAGFDTYIAIGTGRYNGVDGATIEFELTDAGEPGKNDFAQIKITDVGGAVVLDVSGNLDRGNHQAHPT